MRNNKNIISIFLLRSIYLLFSGIVTIIKSNKLINLKIGLGTLIVSLSSSISNAQVADTPSDIRFTKNDTLKVNISLEPDLTELDDIVVTCYYGGPPSYREPYIWGGDNILNEIIIKELVYPPEAKSKGIEGTVELSYIIGVDGRVKDVSIIKALGYGCDEEAMRIVNIFPIFNNGFKDRKPAEFEKTILIEFKLPKE